MRHRAPPIPSHLLLILILSTALFALSIALIALQARVQDAFPDEGRQYPGSSIAEFMFVPLNPSNIDVGPTVAKYAAGACCLLVALLGVAWPVLHWCRASGRASIVHVSLLTGFERKTCHMSTEKKCANRPSRSECLAVQHVLQR